MDNEHKRVRWLELRKREGFEYAHELDAESRVQILVKARGEPLFLVRYERNPAHGDGLEPCSITGGVDAGETTKAAAVRELYEEAGIRISKSALLSLGLARPYKASDSIVHMFFCIVDKAAVDPKPAGDGTPGEAGAYCRWRSSDALVASADPLLALSYLRAKALR